ncbi:hypothetical protein Pmi06nite_63400 [Planotetraspora mira]|uniref:Phage integrase family protein n=1 Tax=Planotetraspora mira TaxID=58121 RepID=A0A8J3XDX0_9ACTN|nr:hypothetical protein Pmi06nite_63400 [Planotetraspora mira]
MGTLSADENTGLLRRYVGPHLGNVALSKIDTAMVREWRATLVGKASAHPRWPSPTASSAEPFPDTGARGGILRRSNFRRAAKWDENTRKIGFLGLHFHDLRHTGNTIAAGSGATGSACRTLAQLCRRLQHSTSRLRFLP